MARSLSSSRAYLAAATSTSSSSISFRRLALRSNSNIPNTPAADPAAADEPSTDPLVRQFEDAVHRIIVRRAAPDWLPFLPGSSYWVPSARSSAGSFGIAHLIQNLANPMTHEEAFSVTTVRGWPSSNYFIKDAKLDPEDVHKNTDELKKDSTSVEVEFEVEVEIGESSSHAPKCKTEQG
ncbi:hypothetical protein LINPERHAP1_LOCUS23867 [Linum perenne]